MATLNEHLAEELKDAGARLLSPHPSVDNLFPLLNEVVRRLELVEQSPSQTMLNALSPSMKALVKDRVKPPPNKEFKESGPSTKVTIKSAKKGSHAESSKKGSDPKNLKRKRAAGKEEALETAELGEELVGCRIKVWWPNDIKFYEAVVESFIPDKKRHKILYTDGAVEVLNMKTTVWEFNKDDEKPLKDAKKIIAQEKAPLVKYRVKPPSKKEFKESGSSTKFATKSAKKVSYTESSKKGSDQKNLKRKRAAGKEEALETAELGEELVGCRIKVWWPDDIMFYEAVVESFFPDIKKHKILYTDGDVEVLNMKKTIWEFNKDDEKPLKDTKKIEAQEKTPLVKDRVKPPPKKMYKESGSSKVATKSAKKGSYAESSKKGSDQENLNRKHAAGKEEALETAELGEELVGSRIKVWWPDDIMFYEAVVESFIPDTKRHKILYTDGDVEELNMKKEIWEFNKDDEKSLNASLSDGENPEASSERKLLCMIRRLEAMEQQQLAHYREFREFRAEFREFHAELRRHQDEQSRSVAAMNQNKE